MGVQDAATVCTIVFEIIVGEETESEDETDNHDGMMSIWII